MTALTLLISVAVVLLNTKLAASSSCAVCPSATFTLPLFHYYRSSGEDDFYTTKWSEVQGGELLGGQWAWQGIAGYIYPYSLPDTVPLYRFWSSTFSDHWYTTDYTEVGFLTPPTVGGPTSNTYTFEGIAGYVYTSPHCGTSPVYRYYQATTGNENHFYSTNYADKQGGSGLTTTGYLSQGIGWYMKSSCPDGCGV